MTKSSFENKEINDFPPRYSTVTGPAQEQTDILIENEQLKAQNEIAMAVLATHILQQEERSSDSRELTKLIFFLCLKVLAPAFSIMFLFGLAYIICYF